VVQVGTPPAQFNLRQQGESSHGVVGAGTFGGVFTSDYWKPAQVKENTMRTINGEALTPPFDPDLEENVIPGTQNNPLGKDYPGERAPGWQSIDQVDAETALSAVPTATIRDAMQWPPIDPNTGYEIQGVGPGDPDASTVQAWVNKGKAPEDQYKVMDVNGPGEGQTMVVYRTLSQNEQKVQLMNNLTVPSSYHSAVMSGRLNHRRATAFDVSIGQARTLDDPKWAALLRGLADWRIPLKKLKDASPYYTQLDPKTRDIVEANAAYYFDGTFPSSGKVTVPATPPAPVVSETVKVKYKPNEPILPTPF